MSNDARRVGSKFETDTMSYLRGNGVSVDRLARAGSLDEGDLVIGGGEFVAELKARRDAKTSLNLGSWLGEAEREAEAYRRARDLPRSPVPVLIVKRPNKGIGDAFVVMSLKDFISGEDKV